MTGPKQNSMVRGLRLAVCLLLLAGMINGCGSPKIVLNYPEELVDFSQGLTHLPALYIDQVTDMRPVEQRTGQGHFFSIIYPKDEAWAKPVTEIYGEALAQDLDQTQLVELVPFRSEAEFVLSVDLLSLSSKMQRSPSSFLLPSTLGIGLGMVLGENASGRASRAALFSILATAAIPMRTLHHAEAEVRMTLRDSHGDIMWQKSCYGEFNGRKSLAPTARADQELVDRFLVRAIKKANACLLGQLRQALLADQDAHPDFETVDPDTR